ncbi:MAG TPA: amidohydrolase [Candidatus Acidoferrales bacterium]|jgi:predicted amidohydrolase YtcJ|nr:amidohydrolase [Candidatus Acidoferrales bacterium]
MLVSMAAAFRALVLVLIPAAVAFAQPADLILRNGKIVTMNPAAPTAQAMAIRGGKIVALGSDADMRQQAGQGTRLIDLHGMLAIPGFIEGHGHFTGVGEFRMGLDLREARTWDDIVAQVGRAAKQAKPGEWIIGRGWHQSKWTSAPEPNVEGFPLHASLDQVSPNNPVLLTHASGHAAFVNGKAMAAAGITTQTPDPPGGEILKDARGDATGLLRERAQGLAGHARDEWESHLSPAERQALQRKAIDLAVNESISKGITTFEDAGSPFDTIDMLKAMAEKHELKLRIWMMLRVPTDQMAAKMDRYRMIGVGGGYFTVRAVKRAIDGALGARGAWLLNPYTDKPDSAGMNNDDPADVRQVAELAIQHGYQMCVHAIGDRANRETLDIFEQTFKRHPEQHPERKDLRWRIEHAQHLSAADIPRFGQLGVIAAMQGVHCTSDAPYVLLRLGPQRAEEGAYVWQKLIKSGAVVGNGTDAPVEDVSPLASFYASVSRKLKDGTVFYPDQRMSREEALKSYTWNNAYAAFEEKLKGSLEVGKLADITVLSRDIMTIPEDEIPATDVVYTIVGGKVAFERSATAR